MDPPSEMVVDLFPYVRVYKDGRIERFIGTQVAPAGVDPDTGVASKDVVIDSDTDVVARIYLPSDLDGSINYQKLPIVVYYHGGAFIIETAFSPAYHNYLNSLVSKAKVIAVSVNYRRAPEHVLPAAYDDSWEALRWVASHANGAGDEAWLAEHGDFGRVFVAGDSAGANIVHNVALRAATEALPNGMTIKGSVLIHPFFWGTKLIGAESKDFSERVGKKWRVACPDSSGVDDPRLNPLAELAPSLRGLPCRRVLVAVAELDGLRERGRAYFEALKGSGWEGEVEMLESEGEKHVFHLVDPQSQKSVLMMRALAAFLSSG